MESKTPLDRFREARPNGYDKHEWELILQGIYGEGARKEKEWRNNAFKIQMGEQELKKSHDPFYQLYEDAQSPVYIKNKNLERYIKEKNINEEELSLIQEGVTPSGRHIPGWDSLRSFSRTQTLGELLLFQDAAFYRAHTDPHGVSLVNNFVNYVVGTGIKVLSPNTDIDNCLIKYRRINKMGIREKHIARGFYIDGEYFALYIPNPRTGDLIMRRVPAREITDLETEPEDMDTILSYKREWADYKNKWTTKWYPDITYTEKRNARSISTSQNLKGIHAGKSNMIQYFKYGNDDESRGRVPMQSVIKFMRYYEDWIIDRIRLNHERTKVVWVRQIDDKTGTASSIISTNPFDVPRGGVILTETPGVKYRIMSPEIGADDVKEDGLAILYEISAGTLFPLYILTQRLDQQVYASIKKADTPFSMMITAYQDLLKEYMKDMYYTVIREYVNAGQLQPKTKIPRYMIDDELVSEVEIRVKEMYLNGATESQIIKDAKNKLKKEEKEVLIDTIEVPLGIHFPPVVKDDALDMAKVFNIFSQLGIVSRATMSTRAGFDWKEERARIMKEKEAGLEPPNSLGFQPGGTSIDGDRKTDSSATNKEDEGKDKNNKEE